MRSSFFSTPVCRSLVLPFTFDYFDLLALMLTFGANVGVVVDIAAGLAAWNAAEIKPNART
jgi:hypothetical protein